MSHQNLAAATRLGLAIAGFTLALLRPSAAEIVYSTTYQEKPNFSIATISTQNYDASGLTTIEQFKATNYASQPSSLVMACHLPDHQLLIQSIKTGVINQNNIIISDGKSVYRLDGPFIINNDQNLIQKSAKAGDTGYELLVQYFNSVRKSKYWRVDPIAAVYTDPADAVGRVMQKCGIDVQLRVDAAEPTPTLEPNYASFPEWTEVEIRACVAKDKFHSGGCWPKHFSWETAPTQLPQNISFIGDFSIPIKVLMDQYCWLAYEVKRDPKYAKDRRIEEIKDRIATLEPKLVEIGWPEAEYGPIISEALKQAMQLASFSGGVCRKDKMQELQQPFEAKLDAYEMYRLLRLTDAVKNPANWPHFDVGQYRAEPAALGFLALRGKDPTQGQICTWHQYSVDKYATGDVVRYLDPTDLPASIGTLFKVSDHGASQIKSISNVYPDQAIEAMVGSLGGFVSSPLRRADCSVMVGAKEFLIKLKEDIERRTGYGVVIFDETVSAEAYLKARTAYRKHLRDTMGPNYGEN